MATTATATQTQIDRDADELEHQLDVKFEPASEVEMKALGDNIPDGYIAGWASTPARDRANDVVLPGAFDESIRSKGLNGPSGVMLLLHHNWQQVPGAIKVLENRGGRLWIEAQLDLNISYARDAYLSAKAAGGLNFSVGFRKIEWKWIINESDDDYDEYREISKADLWEISVVTFPANKECVMTVVKGAVESLADFERSLMAQGLVNSRNEARRVTSLVKSCSSLFTTKIAPPEENPPRLAADDAKSFVDRVKALSVKLAPDAVT